MKIPGLDAKPVACEYAQVIDGRHLWVAVAERPGTLALRNERGDVHAPPDDHPSTPGHLAARLDLSELGWDDGDWQLVLLPRRGGRPKPLASPGHQPTRPRSRNGYRLEVVADAETGVLTLTRTSVPDHVEIVAVSASDDGLRLTVAEPVDALGLLGDLDAEPLATFPVDDDGRSATITPVDVSENPPKTHVHALREGGWFPLRRRQDDTVDPDKTVPLTHVLDPDSGRPLVRVRYDADHLVMARPVPQTTGDDD